MIFLTIMASFGLVSFLFEINIVLLVLGTIVVLGIFDKLVRVLMKKLKIKESEKEFDYKNDFLDIKEFIKVGSTEFFKQKRKEKEDRKFREVKMELLFDIFKDEKTIENELLKYERNYEEDFEDCTITPNEILCNYLENLIYYYQNNFDLALEDEVISIREDEEEARNRLNIALQYLNTLRK